MKRVVPERAARLRAAISEAGGVAAVCRQIGMPVPTLTNYLAGRDMKAEAAVMLADACGVTLEWLLTGRGPMRAADENGAPAAPTPPAAPAVIAAPAAPERTVPTLLAGEIDRFGAEVGRLLLRLRSLREMLGQLGEMTEDPQTVPHAGAVASVQAQLLEGHLLTMIGRLGAVQAQMCLQGREPREDTCR